MHIRTIRPQEVAAVRALCFTAFEANIDFTSSPQASAEQILHAPLTRMQQQYLNTFAAFDEQENPIATVAHCTQRARFDGGIVQMEAIGDVASLPQAQGTGAVRKMFAEILQQAYQQEIPFSYLYPFSEGYYARLGYSCCVKNHIWRLPLSHLPAMSYEGSCRPYLADQQMEAALEQVYSQAAKDWNLSVVREQPEWNRQLRLFTPFKDGYFTYLYISKEGRPTGYFSYQPNKKERKIECRQLFFTDLDALQGMLQFFRSKNAYYDVLHLTLPSQLPLDLLLTEFHLGGDLHTSYALQMHGMVRIVHLQKALRAARYGEDGRLVLQVTDSLLPQNEGTFEMVWQDHQLVSFQPSCLPPEAKLPISLLSRLVCSGIRQEETPFIPVSNPQALQQMMKAFPPKQAGIFDYF